MKKNAEYFLRQNLGNDFEKSLGNSLSKSEVYKPGSKTVISTSDMYEGMRLVPKVLMRLLISELVPMQIGETKEIKIPVLEDTMVRVTKHERDSLSGEVFQNNVKIVEFLHRSIPGIGLVLLSALELYNLDDLEESNEDSPNELKIQKIIDERMQLHSLVNQVIDGKLMQRDAVQRMIISKLNEMTSEHKKILEEHKEITKPVAKVVVIETKPQKKPLPLSNFVENRKKKIAKKEFSIEMVKSEIVNCPDCDQTIFNSSGISTCICFGSDMGKKVYLKKTEDGIKISFPKSWSAENIEMLLEVLRNKT